jgi:hypothetical protein
MYVCQLPSHTPVSCLQKTQLISSYRVVSCRVVWYRVVKEHVVWYQDVRYRVVCLVLVFNEVNQGKKSFYSYNNCTIWEGKEVGYVGRKEGRKADV